MNLTLRALETFIWVARLQSFSGAAQRLHLSQPAVSMRIRQLEEGLGAVLLERSANGLRLTDAGRKCVAYAERMLSLCAELHHQASDASTLAGMVNVGVTETIAVTWFPKLITCLSSQYPQILTELDVDVTVNLWNKFFNGELDCLLVPGPIRSRDVVAEYLGELTFRWVANPTVAVLKKELTPKELGRFSIVTLSRGANLYELIQDWFSRNHVQPKRLCVCNSLSVVIALAKNGVGAALLPENLIREQIDQQALVLLRVRTPPVRISYFCVYPTRGASPAVKVISALAKQTNSFAFQRNSED